MSSTTKCPKCETTFRVSDAQLQVAKGKVRCGSCLNVFKADEHWVTAPAAPSSPASPPATPKTPAPSPAAAPDDEDIRFGDESDDLISDGEDTQEQQAVSGDSSGGDDYSDLFLNLDDLEDDDYAVTDDESFGSGGDESWAKDMLDELEDDSAAKEAHMEHVLTGDADTQEIFANDGYVKKQDPKEGRSAYISGNDAAADTALRDLGMNKPPEEEPRRDRSKSVFESKPMGQGSHINRQEMLSKIEPAPVDIQWQGGARDLAGLMLWGCLSLLAVTGLVLQYGWIKFDTLAKEDSYRPVYAKACDFIGCRLPDQFNPDAIRTSNLVVRSDPSLSYALAVDVILKNTASYTQPFPELELYFSDINNFPVASRRFKPSEYLAGELAGKKKMPSSKAIHISLQILDPGAKAVNYRLEVSPNKPLLY